MMKHLAQDVLRVLRDAGALPLEAAPQSIAYFPRKQTDLAFRFGEPCAADLSEITRACRGTLVREVTASDKYVNVSLNASPLAERVLSNVEALGARYGVDVKLAGANMLVEHTSLSPVYPLNVSTFRSSVIGNALVHLYRCFGANVQARFWVEDHSRQLAVVRRGLQSLRMTIADLASVAVKIDHGIGAVFAATLYRVKASDLAGDGARLNRMFPLAGFDPKVSAGCAPGDMQLADTDKDDAMAIARLCIRGFDDTFASTGIRMDRYDFESGYQGSEQAMHVLQTLAGNTRRPNQGRPTYLLRNAVYYSLMLNECTRAVSVVSARQKDVAYASARLAETVHKGSGRSLEIVCFGDVYGSNHRNDSIGQGIFTTVDGLLSAHARELGQPEAVVAAGIKFALLRLNSHRVCDLSGQAPNIHRDFLQVLQTIASVERQLVVDDRAWSENMADDVGHDILLLKRLAVLPDLLTQVLQSAAFHAVARYVLDVANDTRGYVRRCLKGGRVPSRRLLAASRTVLLNALGVMGIEGETIRSAAGLEVV